MNSELTPREAALIQMVEQLGKDLRYTVDHGRRCCVNCHNFNNKVEGCRLAKDERPPARVMAYGCPAFIDDCIPF